MINLKKSTLHHAAPIWSVAFSPDGSFFATCSSDRNILTFSWPPVSPPNIHKTQHTKTLRYLSFHPTKPLLAVSSFDSQISIYSYTQGN
jgi:WD40 repeat protein